MYMTMSMMMPYAYKFGLNDILSTPLNDILSTPTCDLSTKVFKPTKVPLHRPSGMGYRTGFESIPHLPLTLYFLEYNPVHRQCQYKRPVAVNVYTL